MIVTRRRGQTAAVALLALCLSACGVNFEAQTGQDYTPADGVSNREGSVDVLNALVVSETEGSGVVMAALVNNDTEVEDALVSVEGAEEDADVQVAVADGADLTIPPETLVHLGESGAVSVTGEQVAPGQFIRLTFTFERSEAVTVDVPVFPRTGDYASVPIPEES